MFNKGKKMTLSKRNNNISFSRIAPVEVKKIDENSFFIDFGKDAFGTLELHLESAMKQRIEICLGEVLDSNGLLYEPEPGSPESSRRFRRTGLQLIPGKHKYQLKLPVPHLFDHYQTYGYDCTAELSCPPEVGEIMPFRYCEVRRFIGNLEKENITQLMVHAPFDDDAAIFNCSDERLNKVWNFCKHTIKATSCFGVYIDGDRERLPYAGDALVNQFSHFCLDSNYDIAKDTIEWFCEHGTSWCYEFSMIIPQLAWHYYIHTGDLDFLRKHYEIFKVMTLSDLTREDGLLLTGNDLVNHPVIDKIRPREGFFRDLIDWPVNMRDGYELGKVNTAANSFHASSLQAIAKIAESLGFVEEAKSYHAKFNKLQKRMMELLFNQETGLFIDSEGSKHSSLHACMQPLANGVIDGNNFTDLVKFIKSKGMACSVWASQFLLQALCQAGEAEHALRLMTSEGERSWLGMLDHGATMTMEAWSNELKPAQDWNHPWATCPANIISRHIMGVIPVSPGYRKVSINPQPGGLEFAQITVPTIHGPIHVEFEQKNGKYKQNVQVPDSIESQ